MADMQTLLEIIAARKRAFFDAFIESFSRGSSAEVQYSCRPGSKEDPRRTIAYGMVNDAVGGIKKEFYLYYEAGLNFRIKVMVTRFDREYQALESGWLAEDGAVVEFQPKQEIGHTRSSVPEAIFQLEHRVELALKRQNPYHLLSPSPKSLNIRLDR